MNKPQKHLAPDLSNSKRFRSSLQSQPLWVTLNLHCTVSCILIILQYILYLVYCTLYLPFCMLYLYMYHVQCVLYTASICVPCTVSCIFKDLKFILYLLYKSCLYKIVSCIHFYYIPCTVFCILPKNEF